MYDVHTHTHDNNFTHHYHAAAIFESWKKSGHSNLSYLPGLKQRKSALPVISFMAISASCNTNRIYILRQCQTDIAKRREKSIEPSAPTA